MTQTNRLVYDAGTVSPSSRWHKSCIKGLHEQRRSYYGKKSWSIRGWRYSQCAKLVFEGSRYELKGGREQYRGTFRLDTTKSPKVMDTTFTELDGKDKGKALGIYKWRATA
jgi:hypothetical protein